MNASAQNVERAPLPPPPHAKIGRLDPALLKSIDHGIGEQDCRDGQALAAWLEKFRRMIELNRGRVVTVLSSRLGDRREAIQQAHAILSIVSRAAGGDGREQTKRYPDLPLLNAALYLEEEIARLKPVQGEWDWREGVARNKALVGELPALLRARRDPWVAAAPPAKSVRLASTGAAERPSRLTVFCPNPLSMNTIATLHHIRERGGTVDLLMVRKLTSLGRIMEELRLSPMHLFRRVRDEVLLRKLKADGSTERIDWSSYLHEIGCRASSAVSLAREMGAQVAYVDDFNDAAALDVYRRFPATHGLFTGGGILRPETLRHFPEGVVHAHPGVMPQYRGMDVAHWALLEGALDQIGSSCQLMGGAIDGGQVIDYFTIDPRKHTSIGSVRTEILQKKVGLAVDSYFLVRDGLVAPGEQTGGSRQYFMMHPRLKAMLDAGFFANL